MQDITVIDILTALLVAITGFYAWATFKILKANENVVDAMRQQSDATTRPYLIAKYVLLPDDPTFYLKICNSGLTAAKYVNLKIDKSFYIFGKKEENKDLKNYSLFNSTIDSFPPGAEISFPLAEGYVIFAKDADDNITPKKITISATYNYGNNKKIVESHIIDLAPFADAYAPKDPVVTKLGELVKAISKK